MKLAKVAIEILFLLLGLRSVFADQSENQVLTIVGQAPFDAKIVKAKFSRETTFIEKFMCGTTNIFGRNGPFREGRFFDHSKRGKIKKGHYSISIPIINIPKGRCGWVSTKAISLEFWDYSGPLRNKDAYIVDKNQSSYGRFESYNLVNNKGMSCRKYFCQSVENKNDVFSFDFEKRQEEPIVLNFIDQDNY